MTPAPYPLEVALKFRDGRDDHDGPVYELHPLVGWTKDGTPLVLHWATGRAVTLTEFLADRDSTGTAVASYTFRASRQKVDADHTRTDHVLH